MLHLNTVSPVLLTILQRVSESSDFDSFRLVGGTALSLYLGHRISVDADFFTDSTFDKKELEQAIIRILPNSMKIHETAYGFTWVYEDVKIDFYDWKVPFIKPPTQNSEIRLAAIEDVAAYKLDAIVGRKTEKDYRDVAELLKSFSLVELLTFYQKKFPYNNTRIAIDHLSAVAAVKLDASIVLLNTDSWQEIKLNIDTAISIYFEEIQLQKELLVNERERAFQAILARKKNAK